MIFATLSGSNPLFLVGGASSQWFLPILTSKRMTIGLLPISSILPLSLRAAYLLKAVKTSLRLLLYSAWLCHVSIRSEGTCYCVNPFNCSKAAGITLAYLFKTGVKYYVTEH